MLKSQKIQVAQSERRGRLAELSSIDKPTDEHRAEMTKVMSDLSAGEVELRAAITAEAAAGETGETVEPAFDRLVGEVRMANYMGAVVNQKHLDGAERELNDELNLDSHTIPFEALEDRSQVEDRQDANTPAPATTSVQQRPIMERVFARSSAAWLGIAMPSVPAGQQNFPVMTAGVSPEFPAAGAGVDADAGAFSANTVSPSRVSARYLFRYETLASFAGLESALRSDLVNAMSEALDKRIIENDLLGSSGLTNPTDDTAILTYQAGVNKFFAEVDGRYAVGLGDVRMLIGSSVLALTGSLYRTTQSELNLWDWGQARTGGFRHSAHIPAAASNIENAIVRRGATPGAVSPIWQGVRIIRDETTRAKQGEVTLTAIMLRGFAILRQDVLKRQDIKVS